MEVHIKSFFANNKDTIVEDIIKSIAYTKSDYRTDVYIDFPKNKYLEVSSGYIFNEEFSGNFYSFTPDIYTKGGLLLSDVDFDKYLSHKDYFRVSIVIPKQYESSDTFYTALKYEYQLTEVKKPENYDSKECDIIVWEEEWVHL